MRILILEDNAPDVELLLDALKALEPFTSLTVDSEYSFIRALDDSWDVILADYNLFHFSAIEALNILLQRNLHIPFVIVTGSLTNAAKQVCIELGAADFLLKRDLSKLEGIIARIVTAQKKQ